LGISALSVRLVGTGWPVSGSTTRPSVLKVSRSGVPKKRRPVREFIVACMMAVKRWSRTGMCQKTSRSATMFGPLKQRWSTQSSCAFHPDGWKKSMMHMTRSIAAKSAGSATSVSRMIKKSLPRLMMVEIMPDLKSILTTNIAPLSSVKTPSMMKENITGRISKKSEKKTSHSGGKSVFRMVLKPSIASVMPSMLKVGVAKPTSPCSRRAVAMPITNCRSRG